MRIKKNNARHFLGRFSKGRKHFSFILILGGITLGILKFFFQQDGIYQNIVPLLSSASAPSLPLPQSCQVCFTPNPNCLSMIVHQINHAQKNIYVQAYSFTDPLIGKALIQAKNRGIDVRILLDKSNIHDKRSLLALIKKAHIPSAIDSCHGIAHNKVIIIDDHTVITGSYNFSKSAYSRNAENVLIIKSPEIALEYTHNWHKRWKKGK